MTDTMGAGEPQRQPTEEVDEDVLATGEPTAVRGESTSTSAEAAEDEDVMDQGGPGVRNSGKGGRHRK